MVSVHGKARAKRVRQDVQEELDCENDPCYLGKRHVLLCSTANG